MAPSTMSLVTLHVGGSMLALLPWVGLQNALLGARLWLWGLGMVKPKLGGLGEVVELFKRNILVMGSGMVLMCLKLLE